MKKILSILLVIVVASFLFAPAAMAANVEVNILNGLNGQINGIVSGIFGQVNQVNKDITQELSSQLDKVIAKKISDLDLILITAEVNALNAQIEQKVAMAIKQADLYILLGKPDKVDKVIADLVQWVDSKAEALIAKAAKKGIVVYCEYEAVVIGGQTVLIDPLRIGGY